LERRQIVSALRMSEPINFMPLLKNEWVEAGALAV
jgi:hypothetical protein